MKEIKLTRGQVALVDDEDYDFLMQWKWSISIGKYTYYATRHVWKKGYIRMHRVIMNTPKELVVDHIDMDGLNCQKYNMRNCTVRQNNYNRRLQKNNKTGYRGVSMFRKKHIRATIRVCGKNKYLGFFPDLKSAAMAYDEAAKKYYGEFASLNFK